jgi:hypothetical protein
MVEEPIAAILYLRAEFASWLAWGRGLSITRPVNWTKLPSGMWRCTKRN